MDSLITIERAIKVVDDLPIIINRRVIRRSSDLNGWNCAIQAVKKALRNEARKVEQQSVMTKPFSKAKAIADGKVVRRHRRAARGTKTDKSKRVAYDLSPAEVVALIREHVRRACGDDFLERSTIRTSHGLFFVKLRYARPLNIVADDFWRKALSDGIRLRRHSLGLLFRALRGEVLTD